jgi:hypothetical protein
LSLFSFLYPSATSSLTPPNIALSAMFSTTRRSLSCQGWI